MGRLTCCRFEHSRKVVRAHMDARGYIFEREPGGQSCLDVVLNQPEPPGTQPCLLVRKGDRKCAILAEQLCNKHLSC